MAKKFKIKLVKKSAGKARSNERKEKNAAKACQTRSAEDRIVADAADPARPEIAAFYEAVLGTARPVSQALSSDVSVAQACSANLRNALLRAFKEEGDEYGAQVTRIGTASLDSVRFGIRKPIVSAAVGSVEHLLKGRCRSGPEIVHRDEIAHRWFCELRRRAFDDISVPVMLLH